jgi:hypothetical protein
MPDGNEAALVLYRGTKIKNRYGQEERIDAVQYMPMVAGIKKRLWNSGFVASIHAAPIYKNDLFRFERQGTKQILEHKPAPLDKEPGEIIGAYAIIELKTGGEPIIDVMRKSEIEKSRAQSKTPGSFGWEKFYGQMACKTDLRRCAKGAPQTAVLQQLLERDEEGIAGLDGRQLIEEPRPAIADYRPADQKVAEQGLTSANPTRSESKSPPPPPPEPTLDVVDAEGEVRGIPESQVGEVLASYFDAAGRIEDRAEARIAVERLAQDNQQTIVALKAKRAADADKVVALYRELTSELDPFGLPGTSAKSAGPPVKDAAGSTAPAAGGSPAGTRQQENNNPQTAAGVLPPLERFDNGSPNWPKWCEGVISAIRRATDRGRLAAINGAVGPFRASAPDSIRTDIDLALDERSREV